MDGWPRPEFPGTKPAKISYCRASYPDPFSQPCYEELPGAQVRGPSACKRSLRRTTNVSLSLRLKDLLGSVTRVKKKKKTSTSGSPTIGHVQICLVPSRLRSVIEAIQTLIGSANRPSGNSLVRSRGQARPEYNWARHKTHCKQKLRYKRVTKML